MAAFDQDVTVCRPNPWLRAAAAIPLLVALAVGGLLMTMRTPLGLAVVCTLVLLPAAAGLIFSLNVRRRNPLPKKVPARLRVDGKGVSVDGAKVLDRRAVRGAFLQPWPGAAPTVRVAGRADTTLLEVQVADERDGQALLDALELGVSHTAIRFPGAPPRWAYLALQTAFVTACTAVTLFSPLYGGVVFLGMLLGGTLLRASIHVGADGILTTWLGSRRFYRYVDIAGVTASNNGVVRLRLNTGRDVDLVVHGRAVVEHVHVHALLARIQAAHAAALAGRRPVDVAALVARGGRTAAEWLHALRGLLGKEAAGYRSNAVPEDNLWRVADDPTAEGTARVGAAVALRAGLDEAGRSRLPQIADASASPKVRVAIRAAASLEDEEALVEALEACEAERAG
jgi:hypothetical protein